MKQKKVNVWKNSTIVLGIFCVALIVNLFIQGQTALKESKKWQDTICSEITGTPSWADSSGNIVKTGYIPLFVEKDNMTIPATNYSLLKSSLIDEGITLIYRDGCGWCGRQIIEMQQLGFWEDYEKEGLTINCTK